jgi:hypothetical protein
MSHFCDKGEELEVIKQQIIIVKKDLDDHIEAQQSIDSKRQENRDRQRISDETMEKNLVTISRQMGEYGKQLQVLLDLNTEVSDLKTAWKVGKRMGLGLAVIIATMSVIFGGIYTIKEWIKK